MSWQGPNILQLTLPDDVFAELKAANVGKSYTDKLVGVFSGEYELSIDDCSLFKQYVLEHSNNLVQYAKDQPVFKQILNNVPKNSKLKVLDMWRNHMYPSDYNPLHDHAGLLSFIIYVDIPYTIQQQIDEEPDLKPEQIRHGFTEFIDPFLHYNRTFPVSSLMEGEMFLFPAWVKHIVYPFKNSAQPRVTIAGNIKFDL